MTETYQHTSGLAMLFRDLLLDLPRNCESKYPRTMIPTVSKLDSQGFAEEAMLLKGVDHPSTICDLCMLIDHTGQVFFDCTIQVAHVTGINSVQTERDNFANLSNSHKDRLVTSDMKRKVFCGDQILVSNYGREHLFVSFHDYGFWKVTNYSLVT